MIDSQPGDFIRLESRTEHEAGPLVLQLGRMETCPCGLQTAICVPVETEDLFPPCASDLVLLNPLAPADHEWVLLLFGLIHPVLRVQFQARESGLPGRSRLLVREFWKHSLGIRPGLEADIVPEAMSWDTGSPLLHPEDIRNRHQARHAYRMRASHNLADRALNDPMFNLLEQVGNAGAPLQQAMLLKLGQYLSDHDSELVQAAGARERLAPEDHIRFAGSYDSDFRNAAHALLSGDHELIRRFVALLPDGD